MAEDELIEILARPTWDHLDARLRDAVARNPSNAPLVEVIRAPLRTLELLWREAVPALRGDPLAAERLCATLQAASDAAALVAVAAAAIEQSKGGAADHRPGLVRLRALAILIAAAFRAQPPAQALYAKLVIGGLALQCGPAELLARLEPYGASAEAYENLIKLSVPPIVAAGVASRVYLRGHARDPVELARWRCIFEVLDRRERDPEGGDGGDGGEGTPPPDASGTIPALRDASPSSVNLLPSTGSVFGIAHADGIDEVRVADDGKVELLGAFPWVDTPQPPSLPQLDAGRHAVVGVTAAQTVEVGFDTEATPKQIRARFASDVAWVGFVERARIRVANATRAAIREMLAGLDEIPCVAREPALPGDLLPDYSSDVWPIAEAPPRTATNQLPPPRAVPAEDDAAPRSDRITVVAVRVAAVEGPPPPSQDEVAQLIQAAGYRLGIGLDVVTLPWVEDAVAVVSSVPEGADDPRVPGLLEALARAAARTPGREAALWIAIVSGKATLAVTSTADAAAGIGIATGAGLSCCIARMLEPAEPSQQLPPPTTTYLAAGRLQVPAVCAAPRPSLAERVRRPASRLRVIGRLAGASLELLDPPREEARAAGPGAPEDTGVVAVALDHRGTELVRTPIRGHRAAGPSTFAALIPVSPEVGSVELRRGHLVLVRAERTLQAPTPAQLTLDEDVGLVTATWTTPSAARPVALTVEISGSDGEHADDWVPLTELHDCAARAHLPLWRIVRALRVRLVACDGWNAVAGEPVFLPEDTEFGPCAIRRVNERMLWAELPGGAGAAWTTPVDHTDHGQRLDLVRTGSGEVRLSTVVEGHPPLTDTLDLELRDVYRRA